MLKSVTWVYTPALILRKIAQLPAALEDLRRMDSQLNVAGVSFYLGRWPVGVALARLEEIHLKEEAEFTARREALVKAVRERRLLG